MLSLPTLCTLDWIVVAMFFVITLGIGLYFSKRATSSLSNYFTAGGKMTWWMAGTSIAATTFAADTPLVLAGWMRTIGLHQNWIWWGALLGSMMCTFFFARLWKRSGLLTDVEFCELRYSGPSATGLRAFRATYESLITNTLVMGFVTLAMAKIMDVTLDLPNIVFVKGNIIPLFVEKGVELASVMDVETVMLSIPAKATGIIICLLVAAFYSSISGLWGVIATDFFQFVFAMIGIYVFMIVIMITCGGPKELIIKARTAVEEGKVVNAAAVFERGNISQQELFEILTGTKEENAPVDTATQETSIETLIQSKMLIKQDSSPESYRWSLDGTSNEEIHTRISDLPKMTTEIQEKLFDRWKLDYTIQPDQISGEQALQAMLDSNIIVKEIDSKDESKHFFRFTKLPENKLRYALELEAAGVKDKSEAMASWSNDKVVSAVKITSFLPPKNTNEASLMVIWGFVVFLGLQWWGSAAGGGYVAQRLFSCKNEKHSMLAYLWYNLAHFALRPWPWLIVGIASLALIPDVTAYGAHYDAEHSYVLMFMKYLPMGLRGLMVASLMAAFMSTISTHVNFGASYLVNDVYKRFFNKNKEEKHYVKVSEYLSIVLALVAGLYAYQADKISTVWLTVFMLMSGMSLVMLARWYWWRVNGWSEISAMIASITFSLLNMHTNVFAKIFGVFGAPSWWFDKYPVQFTLTFFLSAIVWVTVTLLTPPADEDHLVEFYKRVKPAGLWGPIPELAGCKNHFQVGLNEFAAWIVGSSGLISLVVGFGKLCFGMYSGAFGLLCYTGIAIFVLFKLIDRMDWEGIH